MSDTPDIKKGLVGVYADVSAVSKVMPETNSLTYRGYPVQDLCENASFDETAYLLWNGELPRRAQLAAFQAEEKANRALSPTLLRVLAEFPRAAHPMDAIRTACSFMGAEDPEAADVSDAAQRRILQRVFAGLVGGANADRNRAGRDVTDGTQPQLGLGFADPALAGMEQGRHVVVERTVSLGATVATSFEVAGVGSGTGASPAIVPISRGGSPTPLLSQRSDGLVAVHDPLGHIAHEEFVELGGDFRGLALEALQGVR
jgi:hypothetical protein